MTADNLPEWLSTEQNVADLFTRFGFEVQDIKIHGRQIDLHAIQTDALSIAPETWTVEITTEKVGEAKGSSDFQKLELARRTTGSRVMLVSTRGFAGPQKETLKALGVVALTYAELERRFLNLDKYVSVVRSELSQAKESDIGFDPAVFIEPAVLVHRSSEADTDTLESEATTWVKDLSKSKKGVLGALLGNLGTGKTTVLQKVQLDLLEQYRAAPSTTPVPLYVSLSRYKHHSGRVDSLIQETLTHAGLATYPTMLVRQLIRSGRLILLFDGLDEVHPISSVDDVVTTATNILDFLEDKGRAVISSRAHLFASSAEEFAIFGPYEKVKLNDVSAGLRKLLAGHVTTEIAYIQPFTHAQTDAYLKATCGDDYIYVRDNIYSMYGFEEMASTPVLLAMMRKTIPELAKTQAGFGPLPQLDLYRAYTDRWIRRDVGRAQLSVVQRSKFSEVLASDLIRRDEFSASWPEIRDILQRDPAWQDNPVDEGAAQADIRNSTFLVREDDHRFRFVHRSIMEFFAAKATLDTLASGERPELKLSDGHARFLAMMVAELWLKTPGQTPFPAGDLSLSNFGDSQRFALLSSASLVLPKATSALPSLPRVRIIGTLETVTNFSRIALCGTRFEFEEIPKMGFEDCRLEGVSFSTKKAVELKFSRCTIVESELDAPQDVWRGIKLYPEPADGIDAGIISPIFVVASRWVENHKCRAKIDGKEWRVPFRCLALLALVCSRLSGRGKISKESWAKGKRAAFLMSALDKLITRGMIDEDASRVPHQLALSAEGRRVVTGIKEKPMEFQKELFAFDFREE